MEREQPVAILDPLRRLINRQAGNALSDAQLLENFVTRRDEASFEVLVWRHGAMVLALCKRVLRDAHEAEDAFQATFLVFARKADSIGRGEVLAAWLYKVAYRIAIRLRAAAAKRTTSTEPTDTIPAPATNGDTDWHDLKPVLDDEIARLPEKYRAPFVLCYLEGRTNEEAAAQLGCPKGTVLSRLARGRERLRTRLTKRGVALTAVAFAMTLSQNAASASVSAALVSPTVGAAIPFAAGAVATELVPTHIAALAEGAMKTMTLVKLKVASAVLALALLGSSIAWAARNGENDSPTPAPVPSAPEASAPVAALPVAEAKAAPVEAQRERPAPTAPAAAGKVTSVAKDGKSFSVAITVNERGGGVHTTDVKLGDKTTVIYNGVGPNGAKPTEGYFAQVWFEGDSKEVAAKVIFGSADGGRRGPDVAGVVVEGKDNKSITLESRPPERGAEPPKHTIPFDNKTVLVFSNIAKDGAKITPGYKAAVWLADDGMTAAKVQFTGSSEPARRDEKRPEMMGKVTEVIEGKSIVLEASAGRGEEPKKVTITLTDKTTVVFNNVPLDGAKITPGMQAGVWLADGSKDTAAKVLFIGTTPERWTTVTGKVVAVAKDGKSFSVEAVAKRGEEPKRVEVKLTDKTQLAFFGVGPGEAKITEGMVAQARLLDGSTDTAQVIFSKGGERGDGRR